MIAVNFSTAHSKFADYCDQVTNNAEIVLITRNEQKNVVTMSAERFNQLEKAERNAEYLKKLDRGLAQVHAGQGIVKTMAELEAMAKDDL